MGKVFCAVCRKRCRGDILKIEQQFVHHKCFQCTKCRKNLQQGGFFVRENRFYCPDDYQSDFGVKCEACRAFVEGEVVTVLGKTFHPHCFRCCTCQRSFTSGERTTILDGAYYCVSCASGVANDVSLFPPAGDTTPSSSSKPSPSKSYEPRNGPHTSPISPWSKQTTPHRVRNGTRHPHTASPSISGLVPDGLSEPSLAFVDGQLTVQVNANGYTGGDSDKHKIEFSSNHIGGHSDTAAMDTLLSTTPGQTFSGGSFILSTSDRRICPPGVDYGRHYPVSYLQLAEKGFTAIMSSEEVPLQPDGCDGRLPTQSLRSGFMHAPFASERQSRRDAVRPTSSSRFTPTPGGRSFSHSTDPAVCAQQNNVPDTTRTKASTFSYTRPSTYSIPGFHTPASLSGRPRRDLYVRRRELSPGAASLGSSAIRYPIRSGRMEPSVSVSDRSERDRVSSRSTPNVRGKRGMTMLAESLIQPRVRPDRSLSPEAVTECWSEARRLASYPNARIPDSTSLPAIERFDFPAPPSPAVVMIEKRREKRLADQRSAADTMDSVVTLKDGTMTSAEITEAELTGLPSHVATKLHQIDTEIETLKRLGESSGITSALIQELEASKLVHVRGPDLDPVSASRSPSANTEPGYKTRYDRHVFASPSRDTRRDRRTAHTLSYRMDYSSTGGRSGTIPSFHSTPRPGYTSGVLYGRAVSLPRPAMACMNGYGASGTIQSSHTAATGLHTYTLSSAQADMSPHGPSVNHVMSGGGGSGDHTLVTDESLHTTSGGFDSQVMGHAAVGSLATSALSMDGLTACSGDDTATLAPSSSAYVIKSGTMTGLSHVVTGLRPVSAMMKQHALASRVRSRTHTPMRHTVSGYDSEVTLDAMDAYPSVQSWLRSSLARKHTSFKTYPYERLKISNGQLPKGIDRSNLEKYLSASDFEVVFGMSLPVFQRLPEWKQNDLKKKVDLI